MERRLYIAGPMRGRDNANHRSFYAAEIRLKKLGYSVINPARIGDAITDAEEIERTDSIRKPLMRLERDLILVCDGIYLLDGWELSEGSKQEREHAVANGLFVYMQGGNEPPELSC